MKPILFFLLFTGCMLSAGIAQTRLTGKVLDAETDTPLTHVTLKLKKAAKLSKTGADGSFALIVSLMPDTLLFSHLGYSALQIPIGDKQTLPAVIRMFPLRRQLQEMTVSTGYQTIKRDKATGSFEEIGAELLGRQVSTNLLDRLDGIANAVLFDKRGLKGQGNISVRGLSTIYANTSPLIVLDNFPYEGDPDNINPNDVESITILKDAAAAAIWGVRAGNGVIVITTKKGKLNGGLKIGFNSNLTMGAKPDIFYPSRMSTADFIDLEKFLFNKGFYQGQESSPVYPALSPVVELLIQARDHPAEAAEVNRQIEALKQLDVRDEMEKYLYQKSMLQQYAFSLSGGSEKLAYLFSAGYDHNTGSLSESRKRLTLRSNNSYRMGKHFTLEIGLLYTQNHTALGHSPFDQHYFAPGKPLYPYARLADENGNPLAVVKDYRDAFKTQAAQKGLLDWAYRPLEEAGLVNNRSRQNEILLNTGLSYTFLKNFGVELKYQYRSTSLDNRNLLNSQTYEVRDLVNRYTQVSDQGALTRPLPVGDILRLTQTSVGSQNIRAQLNYTYTGDHAEGALIAGAEISEIHTNGNRTNTYGYNDNLLTWAKVDYVTSFPLYIGNSARISDGTDFWDITNRLRSFYASGNYTYQKRYSLSASARQDGSNLFGVESNRKLIPLWSAGLAWHISEEKFYHLGILPLLKLRLTYGFNGNMNSSLSALSTIRYNTGNLVGIPYAHIANAPNPMLGWGKTKVLNVGIDFAIKNNRIRGSIEYYLKKGMDLLGKMRLDQTTGAINPLQNFEYMGNSAAMQGKGLDVQLHSAHLSGAFKWETDLNYSWSASKLTAYHSAIRDASHYINGGYAINPIIGKPLYAIFSYPWAGLDPQTGDPMGILGGEVSKDYQALLIDSKAEELQYHGPAMPTHFGAVRNTFSWRGFSLSANISYRLGYYFMRKSVNYNSLFNNNVSHGDYALRWQQAGDEKLTDIPSMIYPNNPMRDRFYASSAVLIEKGDHIRLQDLNLSYRITQKQWAKLPVQGIQPYLYLNNVGILWRANIQKRDPDYVNGLPAVRTLSFGIKLDL